MIMNRKALILKAPLAKIFLGQALVNFCSCVHSILYNDLLTINIPRNSIGDSPIEFRVTLILLTTIILFKWNT